MVRYLPVSIKSEGLKSYLDRTKNQHDGFGYNRFVKEYNKGQTPAALARMFSISRNTAHKWVKIHKNEAEKIKQEAEDEEMKQLS